jgi:hypothetical protein
LAIPASCGVLWRNLCDETCQTILRGSFAARACHGSQGVQFGIQIGARMTRRRALERRPLQDMGTFAAFFHLALFGRTAATKWLQRHQINAGEMSKLQYASGRCARWTRALRLRASVKLSGREEDEQKPADGENRSQQYDRPEHREEELQHARATSRAANLLPTAYAPAADINGMRSNLCAKAR